MKIASAGGVRQSLDSFRADREGDWRAFDELLTRAEKRSPNTLSDDELLSLPILYRSTLSSLSVARATSLDQALIAHLESLSLRGYLYLYGARRGLGERLAAFFIEDWPGAVRDLWRETAVSAGIMATGAVCAFRLVASDPSWFNAIIPASLAAGRGPDATPEWLRGMLYDSHDFLTGFATQLFTHNTQVAILAFALGFVLGVPSILLMLMNGAILGAMFQVYWSKGLAYEFGGWLSIHGSTELLAIVIAGAAGMRIGTALAFPGSLSRLKSAERAGRVAASAMVGVTIMLLTAGLLEGIGRQTITDDETRYLIGGSLLIFWLGYFYVFRAYRHGPE